MARPGTQDAERAARKSTVDEAELIHPAIRELADRLETGDATIDDDPRRTPDEWTFDVVPAQLIPYVKNQQLTALEEAIRRDFWLYWHPIVRTQVFYLAKLRRSFVLWDLMDWATDPEHPVPSEVRAVDAWLEALLIAAAPGMRPGHEVEWSRVARGSGPAGGRKNPHPAAISDEFIGAAVLAKDHATLHLALKRSGVGPVHQTSRLAPIVEEVLNRHGPEWSGLCYGVVEDPEPAGFSEWPRGRQRGWLLQHLEERWRVDAKAIVATWRADAQLRQRKQGKPYELACAILATLLSSDSAPVTPYQVYNAVNHYQRSH